MYKINTERTFTRDVTVIFPGENNQDSKGTLKATYRALSETEYADYKDALPIELLQKVLVSVSGIADQDGNPIPDDKALDLVLNDTFAVSALEAEYVNCTRLKNFRRLRSR
jgi:hypothetical protein